jgi:hypothetical protein
MAKLRVARAMIEPVEHDGKLQPVIPDKMLQDKITHVRANESFPALMPPRFAICLRQFAKPPGRAGLRRRCPLE